MPEPYLALSAGLAKNKEKGASSISNIAKNAIRPKIRKILMYNILARVVPDWFSGFWGDWVGVNYFTDGCKLSVDPGQIR